VSSEGGLKKRSLFVITFMGYTTEFDGSIVIEPPLSDNFVNRFNEIANKRNNEYGDGVEGSFDHVCHNKLGRKGRAFGLISVGLSEVPGCWCHWILENQQHATILMWDGGEKFYYYVQWLQYVIDFILTNNNTNNNNTTNNNNNNTNTNTNTSNTCLDYNSTNSFTMNNINTNLTCICNLDTPSTHPMSDMNGSDLKFWGVIEWTGEDEFDKGSLTVRRVRGRWTVEVSPQVPLRQFSEHHQRRYKNDRYFVVLTPSGSGFVELESSALLLSDPYHRTRLSALSSQDSTRDSNNNNNHHHNTTTNNEQIEKKKQKQPLIYEHYNRNPLSLLDMCCTVVVRSFVGGNSNRNPSPPFDNRENGSNTTDFDMNLLFATKMLNDDVTAKLLTEGRLCSGCGKLFYGSAAVFRTFDCAYSFTEYFGRYCSNRCHRFHVDQLKIDVTPED